MTRIRLLCDVYHVSKTAQELFDSWQGKRVGQQLTAPATELQFRKGEIVPVLEMTQEGVVVANSKGERMFLNNNFVASFTERKPFIQCYCGKWFDMSQTQSIYCSQDCRRAH